MRLYSPKITDVDAFLPLNTERVLGNLKTAWIGRPLLYFQELPSTNSWLKSNELHSETGTVAVTDFQTQGRGQYRRNWMSVPNANLTLSVMLRPGNPHQMHSLTLVAALTLCDALKPILGERCCIKWPNDVHFKGRKIAGILVESSFTGGKLDKVIMGIGLNVNQMNFDGELSNAGSVRMAKADLSPVDRDALLAHLLNVLEDRLNRWEIRPSSIRKEVNYRLIGYGCYGTVYVSESALEGIFKFMGINEEGFPVFLNEEADIRVFKSEQIRFIPDGGPCEPIIWDKL